MKNHISTQAINLLNFTKNKTINSRTKLVTITSGKGGVGKSTLSVNFASLLSLQGYKVAILDADVGLANLQVQFNVKPKYNMFDYIDGRVSIDNIYTKINSNLFLVAGKSGYEDIEHKTIVFRRVCEKIMESNQFDILIADTGAGLNAYLYEFLDISTKVVAITTTDPSALTDVYALMKMVSKVNEELMICFNFTQKYDTGAQITESLTKLALKNKINRNFMLKYLGNVEESRGISTTSRLRKTYTKEFQNEIPALQMQEIVQRLLLEIGVSNG